MEWTAELKKEWVSGADPLKVSLGEERMPVYLEPRVFTSTSVGYFANTKITLEDGLRYQATITLVVIGSRDTSTRPIDIATAAKSGKAKATPRRPRKASEGPKVTMDPPKPPDAANAAVGAAEATPEQPIMFEQ